MKEVPHLQARARSSVTRTLSVNLAICSMTSSSHSLLCSVMVAFLCVQTSATSLCDSPRDPTRHALIAHERSNQPYLLGSRVMRRSTSRRSRAVAGPWGCPFRRLRPFGPSNDTGMALGSVALAPLTMPAAAASLSSRPRNKLLLACMQGKVHFATSCLCLDLLVITVVQSAQLYLVGHARLAPHQHERALEERGRVPCPTHGGQSIAFHAVTVSRGAGMLMALRSFAVTHVT